MSQVKFYKGISNNTAISGKDKDNHDINIGGIIFSSGETNKSKRIYTAEQNNNATEIVEYYKEDLQFDDNTSTNKSLGTLPAGTDISNMRVMDVLNLLLFTTYIPKFTYPTVSATNTFTYTNVPSDGYILKGTANVSYTTTLTVTQSAAAQTTTSDGKTTVNSTSGGDLSSIKYKYDNGTETSKSADAGQNSVSVASSSVDISTSILGNTISQKTYSGIKYSSSAASKPLVVTGGVKNSDGSTATYVSTSTTTQELKESYTGISGVSNELLTVSDLRTAEEISSGAPVKNVSYISAITDRSVTATDSGKKTLKIYLPIYHSEGLDEVSIGDYASDTSLPGGKKSLDTVLSKDLTVNGGTISNKSTLGKSDSFSLETTNGSYIRFVYPTMTDSTPYLKFALPDGIVIDNDTIRGKHPTSDAFATEKASMSFEKDSTAVAIGGNNYYIWTFNYQANNNNDSSILKFKIKKA